MAAGPMKMRATLAGGYTDIRVLMTHPMETGQRKDADGKLVPVHFIQNIRLKVNGKTAVESQVSQGLPRYFKDADRVMDLETRLLHCMTTLQGRTREEATARVFGSADRPSEMESLSAYVAAQSRGMKLAPGMAHPKEKEAFELGPAL